MPARVFIDTNVLVYLFDRDAPATQAVARRVLAGDGDGVYLVISTQVLQEFYVMVTRKLGTPLSEGEAESAARDLAAIDVVDVDRDMVFRAIAGARARKISLWDALIVEAGQTRGCQRLLTEDLQHGQLFGHLRVENPFRDVAQ